jgi:predicted Zn-dependent protease
MAKAGYNPKSALELWGLLNMLEQDSHDGGITAERVLPFLRTHPQGDVRLESLRKILPQAMEIYHETQKPSKAQRIRDSIVNPDHAS